MEIYVVQQGDDIYTIAEKFGVSADKIIRDNGLNNPSNLVIGQTIVIVYPKQSHIVQDGDTLQDIADAYDVPLMQLLRNNPHLTDRGYLVPGEALVISYNTERSAVTNGFAYSYIKRETLAKILPNLTYLSVFNYSTIQGGGIIAYDEDDMDVINMAKEYGTIPLMMITTLTSQGVPNLEVAYDILTNEEYQDRNINEFVAIMKQKGYSGLNIILNYLTENNQSQYFPLMRKISERLQQEGLLFFATINYSTQEEDGSITVQQIDYSQFSMYLNGMLFLKFLWGTNVDPPAPVSNINNVRAIAEYVSAMVPAEQILIGKPILGYDWQLPYIPGRSYATSISIDSAIDLAYGTGAVIQFDDVSQTPYFYYNQIYFGAPVQHIVWFIDARSINALDDLIVEFALNGSGIWNVMIYYPQVWTLMNARFDIIKL